MPSVDAPPLHEVTTSYVSRVTVQDSVSNTFTPEDIDNFSVRYSFPNGCYVTSFNPAELSPNRVVSIDVASSTYQIEMDTLENQAQGVPTFCGPRTLSYVEDVSGAPLSFVAINDVSQTYFELAVSSIPASVSVGDVYKLTVSVSLTNYPAITYSLPVTIDF